MILRRALDQLAQKQRVLEQSLTWLDKERKELQASHLRVLHGRVDKFDKGLVLCLVFLENAQRGGLIGKVARVDFEEVGLYREVRHIREKTESHNKGKEEEEQTRRDEERKGERKREREREKGREKFGLLPF
jgi:hypothetical protein